MNKVTQSFLIFSCWLLSITAIGCRPGRNAVFQQDVAGRWAVQDGSTLTVPNSFFWFSMDVIEFRPDGTVLGLMFWPPDSRAELRLNKTAEYRLLEDGRMEIVGSCRHEDPCGGVYDLSLSGESLRLFNDSDEMQLKRSGPATQGTVPRVIGPVPTPLR